MGWIALALALGIVCTVLVYAACVRSGQCDDVLEAWAALAADDIADAQTETAE